VSPKAVLGALERFCQIRNEGITPEINPRDHGKSKDKEIPLITVFVLLHHCSIVTHMYQCTDFSFEERYTAHNKSFVLF